MKYKRTIMIWKNTVCTANTLKQSPYISTDCAHEKYIEDTIVEKVRPYYLSHIALPLILTLPFYLPQTPPSQTHILCCVFKEMP